MPLLVPPEQEQHAVVEYLDNDFHRTSKLIKAAEKTIVALNEYRTALITAAVTGTIDVREAMS
jgi:type I restriction enzyme S subunit